MTTIARTDPSIRLRVYALLALSGILFTIGVALTATRATAVFMQLDETGRPGYLVLSVDSNTPLWSTLRPGETSHWLVQAKLEDAPWSSLTLQLEAREVREEARDLLVEVASCDTAFDLEREVPSCAGAYQPLVPPTPISQFEVLPESEVIELADLYTGEPRELLVSLTLPATSTNIPNDELARVGVGLHAAGDSPAPVPGPEPGTKTPLPVTGADLLPLGLLGLGLIGLGTGLLLRRRER